MTQINPQQKLNAPPLDHIHQQSEKILNVDSNMEQKDQTYLNPHQNETKIMDQIQISQNNKQQICEQKEVENIKQLNQQQVIENEQDEQVKEVKKVNQQEQAQKTQKAKDQQQQQVVEMIVNKQEGKEQQQEKEVEEIQNNLSIQLIKQETVFQKQKEVIEKNAKQQIHQEFNNEMKISISYVEDKNQSQAKEVIQEDRKQKQQVDRNKQQQQENSKSQLLNEQNQIQQEVQQEKLEKNEERMEENKVIHHPLPIIMTQENEQQYTNTIQPAQNEQKQKIVEFEEYSPNAFSNLQIKSNVEREEKNIAEKQKSKVELPVEYQNIQNEQLLKRIQELQQTVSILKKQKEKENKQDQKNQSNSDIQPGITATNTRTIDVNPIAQKKKKKKEQIIHDQSVHGLVTQLAKTDAQGLGKKPVLQQKRYKRRKLDLSSLMDKNMTHASNIFNVTIGQILNPSAKDEEQKQVLRKQIKNLRQKCLKLEQDKRVLSTQKPGIQTRRETASTGKKSLCGKLIKVSELKGSRITGLEDNDSLYKVNQQLGETKSQRESVVEMTFRNKISNNSSTQRQDRQKDNPNNISFRVRRPSNRFNSGTNTPLNETFEKQKGNEIAEDQKISMFPVSSVQLSKQKTKQKKEEKQIQVIEKQWWQQPFIHILQMPELPSPPTQFDTQQDLYTLGKLTFIAFGVDLNQSSQMTVKKYKNCVYFNAGQKNNILWYFDGRFYFGQWQVHLTGQGQKSGEGFEHVPGKFIYQGNFKEGKRNGFGTMKILNKQQNVIYEGNWVDGNKTGAGKQVDQYGVKYWGEWKQNKRQGFGRLKLQDGDYFQGNFQKGIKTGEGTQFFKNGDKYQGNYLANKFHGKGKYFWKNGSVYDGDFNHGIRSGNGKWKSSQISAQYDEYQGQYDQDKKNGYGKYKWADGSQYEGFFKDDLKEGQGTIRYKNGKVAKLLWKNGQPMKKIFSQEQKNYREGQKSKQKSAKQINHNGISRNQTISSRQFSLLRDQ